MKYRLIYVNLLGEREVETETATDDDIDIFINNATDIAVTSEDTSGRVEFEMESGIGYIYEPIEEENNMTEKYYIVEVKPGVYVGMSAMKIYRLTDNLKDARRFKMPGTAKNVAQEYFGEVKTLKITLEVE